MATVGSCAEGRAERKGVERLTSQLKRATGSRSLSPVARPPWASLHRRTEFARGSLLATVIRANKGSFANLFTGKDTELLSGSRSATLPARRSHHHQRTCRAYFKDELPSLEENPSYLYGWLRGYFAADGCVADDGDSIPVEC